MTVITSTGNGITGSTRLQPVVRLRITRRGKLVAALALAILVLSIAWLSFGSSAVATDSVGTGDFQYVTVQAGQSLWDLAHSIAPKADPRDVIAELSRLNGIQGSVIHPGEQLAIPPIYSR
ncbi:MAG: LysM peptidoglycan-binding domain-containing protein [Cryobacterium sp.]|nr:LysM peptidoglycan-binding domain-containing protein [Cryobacterium sp.]MBX3090749.1 LysM peptidoglycan-binding domain-containing protein [Cryobacterium sp.]MCO5294139.1 LysM peptidoglycan-binding domain-containing protein [Homoserinimonas sp.]